MDESHPPSEWEEEEPVREACVLLPPPSHSTLDEVRRDVAELASSEAVDKATALRVTRLFHKMEVLLLRECQARDEALAEARSSLERQRLEGELDRFARRSHAEQASAAVRHVSTRRR